MMPTRMHDRAGAAAWLAAPALLSALSQFGAVAFFARHGGPARALELQAMLSLWAWTLVGAFGLDRAARAFAGSADGLGGYARAWRRRLAALCLGSVVIGAAMGSFQSEGAGAWAAYGLCVGACSLGFAGREWMLARGEAVAVAKTHSLAFVAAAAAMALAALGGAPWGWVAVMWFAPHAAVWMAACARMGLFAPHDPDGVGEANAQAGHGAYGLQAMGHVALCSMDVVLARALLDQEAAFAYVVYSRLAFAAFLASSAFGSVFVGRAQGGLGARWSREFWRCSAVHAGFALMAVGVLACAGPWITRAWLGGAGLALGMGASGLLAIACAGRAIAEAGMQTLSGEAMRAGALASAAGAACGLALFAAAMGLGWTSPLGALALAWLAPSLGLLAWVARAGSASSGA